MNQTNLAAGVLPRTKLNEKWRAANFFLSGNEKGTDICNHLEDFI